MSTTVPGLARTFSTRALDMRGQRARILYRRLIAFTTVVTLALIMMGAWVRLTDAGLGCPDWPGCYGHFTPHQAADKIAAAVAEQGGEHGPVSMGKAWREMSHRYVAKVVGLLSIAIAVFAWMRRKALAQSPWPATVLVGVVVLQGLFGMWTVTLQLMPIIVTGHLIGGMIVFCTFVWLLHRQMQSRRYVDAEPVAALRGPALAALAFVALQVFLGGWTSTNYAALACHDLPTCQGAWLPATDFGEGFKLVRPLGLTPEGELLPLTALTAIHLTHRVGAIAVLLVVGWLAARTLRTEERALGIAVGAMLAVQLLLGLSNVYFALPLPVAVAHNGGAAVLLGLLVVLSSRAARARLQV